ncbi:MAG: flavodoxin domain-containing protein [Candidatus Scalindua sp.]|nr:flavodoxin domain-containing protein [Candidatus Scalindua sp.]
MKNILIAYYSRTGNTEKMAEYIAEGVRFSGNNAEIKKLSEIKSEKNLDGYDGYVFGCPTYHRDMTENMKTFLFLAEKANLEGKVGGAFGAYTHSGDAPKYIFDTMQHVFKMDMTQLGSLLLEEKIIGLSEGLRTCQDYGKVLGEKLK